MRPSSRLSDNDAALNRRRWLSELERAASALAVVGFQLGVVRPQTDQLVDALAHAQPVSSAAHGPFPSPRTTRHSARPPPTSVGVPAPPALEAFRVPSHAAPRRAAPPLPEWPELGGDAGGRPGYPSAPPAPAAAPKAAFSRFARAAGVAAKTLLADAAADPPASAAALPTRAGSSRRSHFLAASYAHFAPFSLYRGRPI